MKLIAFEVSVVEEELRTVTGTVAIPAKSELDIEAVNREALTKVVVRLLPFHRTTESASKPSPSTVRIKFEEPTTAVNGVRLVREGMTVSVRELEVWPPGFWTVMGNVSTTEMSVGGIEAVNCTELTNVVERLLPFQRTIEPLPKFAPLTVSANPEPPARTVVGERLEIEGVPDCVDVIGIGPSDKKPITAPIRIETATILVRLRISNPLVKKL